MHSNYSYDPKTNPMAQPGEHIETRLISTQEVGRITGLPRWRIYWLAIIGDLPKPIRWGMLSLVWMEDQILEWVDARR